MNKYELEETYKPCLHAFAVWMKQAGFTDSTQKEYKREVNRFLLSLDGMQVQQVTKLQIVTFLVDRNGTSGSQSRNRTLSALRTFYAALIDFDLAKGNPAHEVKTSKTEKNKKPVYLEPHQLEQVIDCIEGRYRERNMAIFLLMGYCGLRVGEVHRLNLNHFDEVKQTITVLGKGRKWNEIPLPDLLVPYMVKVAQNRITPAGRVNQDAFFISQKGRRLSIRQVQKIAGLTFDLFKTMNPDMQNMKLSCHKLRHSFATLLLHNEVDIRIVKELMGHASIETTMIYTHVHDEQKKKAMSKVKLPRILPN